MKKNVTASSQSHHRRVTERANNLDSPSPRWWGPAIGVLGMAGGATVLISYLSGSPHPTTVVAALGCWAAALLMAMRWH